MGQFREGTSVFINARGWAKTQQEELIAAVKNRVTDMARDTSALEASPHQPTVEPLTPESETSADELSQDVSQRFSLSHKRLKRELEKHIPPKKSYSGAKSRSQSKVGARRLGSDSSARKILSVNISMPIFLV